MDISLPTFQSIVQSRRDINFDCIGERFFKLSEFWFCGVERIALQILIHAIGSEYFDGFFAVSGQQDLSHVW